MEPKELLKFMHLAEKLKDATRHCYTSGGRHESVADHSWRMTLMAFLVRDEFPDYDIWIRNVITHTNLEHWDIWQYTDKMKLNGYNGKEQFIDMNVRFR